jgi:hypothetical protein
MSLSLSPSIFLDRTFLLSLYRAIGSINLFVSHEAFLLLMPHPCIADIVCIRGID